MVFESIVADVLNRFVGEYVENLDKKQLKIGIWGGKWCIAGVTRTHAPGGVWRKWKKTSDAEVCNGYEVCAHQTA